MAPKLFNISEKYQTTTYIDIIEDFTDNIEDENQFNSTSSADNCLNLSTKTILIEDPKIKKILSSTDRIINNLKWAENYLQTYLRSNPTSLDTTDDFLQASIKLSKKIWEIL